MYPRTLVLCASSALVLLSVHAATQNLTTTSVAAGSTYSLALRSDGTVWSFGQHTSGALGLGTVTSVSSPMRIPELSNMIAISSGPDHALAVDSQGFVWSWGINTDGQLGIGSQAGTNRPTKMNVITNALAVSAGSSHSLILLRDGRVMACGIGTGVIGDNNSTMRTSPVQSLNLTNAVEVSAGFKHSIARTADGKAWVWGLNTENQLGIPSSPSKLQPTVLSLNNVAGVAAGANHTLAVLTDGTVYSWGTNDLKQLGITGITTASSPTQIPNLSNVKQIRASCIAITASSVALGRDGSLRIWGYNSLPPLANLIESPQLLTASEAFVSVSQGDRFVLAVTPDGSVWARGRNVDGQSGNGYANSLNFSYDSDHLRFSFAPFPIPRTSRIDRGQPGQIYNSRIVPLDFEQAVARAA